MVDKWGIDVRGNFEPLIDEQTFARVQAVRAGRAPTPTKHNRNHPDFPLRHFGRCASCGRPLTGGYCGPREQRYPYYWCPDSCNGSRATKAKLEEEFVTLLALLKPTADFLAVFEASVIDVWEQYRQDAEQEREAHEKQIARLRQRKKRLVDVYVYEAGIDKETYQAEMDRISEMLTLAEMDQHATRIEELDIQGVLAFARNIAMNAGRLWLEAPYRQKRQLQRLLFPDGLQYAHGTFLNPVTCPLFNHLDEIPGAESRMAPQWEKLRTPFSPNCPLSRTGGWPFSSLGGGPFRGAQAKPGSSARRSRSRPRKPARRGRSASWRGCWFRRRCPTAGARS